MEEINLPLDFAKIVSNNCKLEVDSQFESNTTRSNFLSEIPVLDTATTKYEDFFLNYLMKNQPCLFTKDITSSWASRSDWVDPDGRINFNFLRKLYGEATVSVTRIQDQMSMEYGGMDCEPMKFSAFIDYWIKYLESGYPSSMPCLYLKDWHIVKDSTQRGYKPYVIPVYFCSDWLNEISEGEDDDFRFAYMGPKGSWTPFHSDVYGSYSWSANITGQKKWRLYSPGNEQRFLQPNGQIKYDFNNPGVKNEDFIEIVQNSGEIIFIPSGWHHIVWNETDTISINHNWMNGSNICHIWTKLTSAMNDVRVEIDDLKSMDGFFEQCQIILKANHGMDYDLFINIVEKIWNNRQDSGYNSGTKLGPGHITFDLKVLCHLVENHMLKEKDLEHWNDRLQRILSPKS